MQIGIFTAVNPDGPSPTVLARAVEERGFESLFVPEHTHIPVAPDTAHPDLGEIPREYARNFDPIVALTAAAAATVRIRLGTAVLLLAQRDPIVTAKALASLDVVAGGRLEVGIGAGWLRQELRNHGTDPRTRVALMNERLLAMRQIWTGDEAEFHGEHVDFDPIYSWPKPLQSHVPVLFGGWGPTTFQRIVDHADGWLAPTELDDERLSTGIAELQALAARSGRPPVVIVASCFDPRPERLEHFAVAGVNRALLGLLTIESPSQVLRVLDRYAGIADPLLRARR